MLLLEQLGSMESSESDEEVNGELEVSTEKAAGNKLRIRENSSEVDKDWIGYET